MNMAVALQLIQFSHQLDDHFAMPYLLNHRRGVFVRCLTNFLQKQCWALWSTELRDKAFLPNVY